jgi:uncharacterized protein YutE (UPF0331/DUF86 family)
MPSVLKPICSFESIDPMDLLSAVQTNTKLLPRTSVRLSQLGLGFETFLRWAKQDVETAKSSTDTDEETRFAVSALMNARRSLSCLIDQYLLRDGFNLCKDAPRSSNDKAALLVRRGVFDSLAADALGRAADRRNRVEHLYEQLDLKDVQDTLQLVRATIESSILRSDPYWAPALFGIILGGHSGGPQGEEHHFDGWSGLLFVLARCDSPPWFGIVVPSSQSVATVRRVALRDISCDQLLDLLGVMESQSSSAGSGYGEATFRRQLVCAGLVS